MENRKTIREKPFQVFLKSFEPVFIEVICIKRIQKRKLVIRKIQVQVRIEIEQNPSKVHFIYQNQISLTLHTNILSKIVQSATTTKLTIQSHLLIMNQVTY